MFCLYLDTHILIFLFGGGISQVDVDIATHINVYDDGPERR